MERPVTDSKNSHTMDFINYYDKANMTLRQAFFTAPSSNNLNQAFYIWTIALYVSIYIFSIIPISSLLSHLSLLWYHH
ncbi:hypothetical protein BCR42DRAFT_405281 [Absidia repens]|uniref:Uncharacterized protein n=1 Tax=Absidia repens TaxID=90262 RepID=A0A1X2IT83_9FUNG|nr:hypothetical protein BCR42DRAFT_405281 [Absidia repens]